VDFERKCPFRGESISDGGERVATVVVEATVATLWDCSGD
jgi:hypothetical protein